MDMKQIQEISVSQIKVYDGAHNTDASIEALKQSIQQFGVVEPIYVDKNYEIISGAGVYRAVVELGHKTIPCVVRDDLTEEQVIQYRIADNKTGEFARWNEKKLRNELSYMQDPTALQYCFDENISAMLGLNSNPLAKPKKDSEEAKADDTSFREGIKATERAMQVAPRKYMRYVCSKCGKEVTLKL